MPEIKKSQTFVPGAKVEKDGVAGVVLGSGSSNNKYIGVRVTVTGKYKLWPVKKVKFQ